MENKLVNVKLNFREMPDVKFVLYLDYWKQTKPESFPQIDIIVTHSAPSVYRPMVYPETPDQVLTEHLLNRLHALYPNTPWFCGHYHMSHIQDHFRCLNINEFYELS